MPESGPTIKDRVAEEKLRDPASYVLRPVTAPKSRPSEQEKKVSETQGNPKKV